MKFKLNFLSVFLTSFLAYVIVGLSVTLSGINPLVLQSEDFLAIATVPFSILKEGNLDLNEYYDLLTEYYPQPDGRENIPYYLGEVNGKYYSDYPMFAGIVATPLYIVPAILGLDHNIDTIRHMSRIGGAFITALSVGFFYLILKEYKLSRRNVLILLFIYAFASNTFVVSSQGLWQQSTSQLFLSAGLYYLMRRRFGLSGLMMGLTYVARPTNLVSVGMFGLFIFLFSKNKIKSSFVYGITAIIGMSLDVLINYSIFGSVLNAEYGGRFKDFTYPVWQGMAGMWYSPSKGILAVTPVFIFISYGIYYYARNYKSHVLELCLTLIVLLHTLVYAKWVSWFGGYSWGYRMATEMVPFLVILLIPFVTSEHFKKSLWKALFYVLLFVSFFIQALGIIYFDSVWHTLYDGKPGWLWNIWDSQAMFSLRRGLFKFNLVESSLPKIVE